MTAIADLETERAVLGAVLLAPQKTLPEALSLVAADDFFLPAHRAIFRAAVEIDKAAHPVDAVGVWRGLEADSSASLLESLGGRKYLDELMVDVITVATVGFHARALALKARRRRMVDMAIQIAADGQIGGDDEDFLERAEQAFTKVMIDRPAAKAAIEMRPLLRTVISNVETRYQQDKDRRLLGVPTGFDEVDSLTSGLRRGDLVILAARPSMGKTSFALNAMLGALRGGVSTLFLSLEMSNDQIGERLISSASGVDAMSLRMGTVRPQGFVQLSKHTAELADLPGWFDDSSMTVREIRAKARQWRTSKARNAEHALVVVDYLQLIRSEGRYPSREREIAEISAGLKSLAKELACPVMALSQLSRGPESRADKRPQLSDLRDSGAIEQDADLVAFLYRDEVYNPKSESPGTAELIIGKNRCGPTATVRLRWRPEICRFESLAS